MQNLDLLEKKISIIEEISNVIVVTDNFSVIANLILDFGINYTDAEKGSLMLPNEKGELYIVSSRGIDLEFISEYRVKIGEGIAGVVAKNLTPVLVNDIDHDERFMTEKRDRYKTKSFISCPVVSRSKLLGILNINDKKTGTPFTDDEFYLIKIIANQAAIALENVFLVHQLKLKAAELEEINRKLIETDVMKTEFFTRVSHELRTPLNSIKGSMYYLQHTGNVTKSEQTEFYKIVSDETDKLSSTVETQLDFLTHEDESRLLTNNLINLSEIFSELLNSKHLTHFLNKKNISLEINRNSKIPEIVGDKIRIFQFFSNIIEGLSIFLDAGDTLCFNVIDDDNITIGINVPRSVPETVFSELSYASFLLNKNQTDEKLKLYLAKKIADLHRWVLETQKKDNGLLIIVTIPKSKRRKIEAAIASSIDLFLEFTADLMGLDVCSILLSDELSGDLTIKSARGLPEDIVKTTRIRPGDQISGWVACEGKPLLIENIENDPRFGKKNTSRYNTNSLISLPLKIQDKIVGVLNLNNKKSACPFTSRDLQLATLLGERISLFIQKFHEVGHNEDDFKQLITTFETLINTEKKYHKKSSLFPDLMMRILDRLGTGEEDTCLALYISKIYDLGLMLVNENLLKKKSLQPSELSALKTHPFTTVSLFNNFESSEDVKKAIIHHHEHYDGTGYPDRLKGEEIPFLSRALSVVDAFCSMISPRPYRKARTRDEALQEIRKSTGILYDPSIVAALEEVYQELPI